MGKDQIIREIQTLTREDCVAVAEAVRDRLAPRHRLASSDAELRAELDRRLADAELHPEDELPWVEVRKRLFQR